MKVLGTTEKGFLVECTDNELCSLMGIRDQHLYNDGPYRETGDAAKVKYAKASGKQVPSKKIDWVGLSIPIADIYSSARKVAEGWDKNHSLLSASTAMRDFADKLDMIRGTYMPLMKDEGGQS